jgi:phosphatidate cytidylyltransferase
LKNFIQRAIFGSLYLVVIIGSLLGGSYAFGITFLLISLLALHEFYSLAGVRQIFPGLLLGAGMFVLSFLAASQRMELSGLLLVVPLVLLIFIIDLFSASADVVHQLSRTFAGVIYISLPISLMNLLVFPPENIEGYTWKLVLGILILIWINDTGAYLVGISIGKHRLFERISPKKSWEGAIGGTIITFLAAWWMQPLMDVLSRFDWLMLAAVVSVFGVLGDLTESMLKRNAGQKDSGRIIPGHGGILDRIDSILFVMPLSAVYLVLHYF